MSFKTLLILAILIAPCVYAYLEKPLLVDHQTRIYQRAVNSDEPLTEEQLALPLWEKLDFIDWIIVTGTKDREKVTLVSIGIGKYVKVMDTDWAPDLLGIKKDEKKTL
jgi:hypothetical protein